MHEKKPGQMEKQIAPIIRQNAKVLLVLSEQAIKSDWMERELQDAGKLEKEVGRSVLYPVALDDRWKSNHLPKHISEQIMMYNILDVSDWRDNSKFDGLFSNLMDGLGLFHKE